MIYKFLAAWFALQTDILAIIVDRYGPLEAAETDVYPYVTYKTVAGNQIDSLGGLDGLVSERVQVDIWSDDPDTVTQLFALICGSKDTPRLNRYSGTLGGVTVQGIFRQDWQDIDESPAHGESKRPFRRSVDFEIWYEEGH